MNLFDQLYEVPDVDDHLEPVFDVDPYWNMEYEKWETFTGE